MPIGPVEGSPISLLQAHEPFASQVAPASEPATDALTSAGEGFLGLVIKANERAQAAMNMSQALAAGQSDDIHGTMLALSKADIELRLVGNIRNKVVDAFYELWRMQI